MEEAEGSRACDLFMFTARQLFVYTVTCVCVRKQNVYVSMDLTSCYWPVTLPTNGRGGSKTSSRRDDVSRDLLSSTNMAALTCPVVTLFTRELTTPHPQQQQQQQKSLRKTIRKRLQHPLVATVGARVLC